MRRYPDPTGELLRAVLGQPPEAPKDGFLRQALLFVTEVRDDPQATARILGKLEPEQITAMCVVLAALVPDDRPAGELLAWMDRTHTVSPHLRRPRLERTQTWSDSQLRQAHAAYAREMKEAAEAGIEFRPSDWLLEGEREYTRRRRALRRQRAREQQGAA